MTRKKSPGKNENFHISHIDRLSNLDGAPLTGFRRRSVAFIIDLIVVVTLNGAFKIEEILSYSQAGTIEEKVSMLEKMKDELLGLAAMVLYFGLVTYFFHGQTLGKWIMRIRVVSLKHEKLTLWQSIERSLGYGASALEAGFGFLQIIWDDNRQAVHDRIAETIVVRLKKTPKIKETPAYFHKGSTIDKVLYTSASSIEETLPDEVETKEKS